MDGADDYDKVTGGIDAGGKFGGFVGRAVFFLEKLFGAGFGVGEIVECVLFGVFASGSVVDIDSGIAFFFESGLLGAGGAWRVGTIENQDGRIFVFAWVTAEHFGDVFLDFGVIIGAAARKDI